MIINNPDNFKAWMTKVLEPLCDADPDALAKYVYALVKKDKSLEELKKILVAQLEVFLQKSTMEFVNILFKKLEEMNINSEDGDEGFENKNIKPEPRVINLGDDESGAKEPDSETGDSLVLGSSLSTSLMSEPPESGAEWGSSPSKPRDSGNSEEQSSQPLLAAVVQPLMDHNQTAEDFEKLQLGASNGTTSSSKLSDRERHTSQSDYRADLDREDRDRGRDGRRRNSSGSPANRRVERSRSRSWERRTSRRSRSRSRQSRSRGRDRDRSRPWRNKSPPSRSRARRQRSWSKSPPPRSSRSRTPPSKSRSRYRNRSPFTRSHSSHSPYDSSHRSNPTSPAMDSSLEDDFRSQNVQSVVTKLVRCKDFDEKGFCMRGEMCPYDHGSDPVVLENLGQVLTYSAPLHPTTGLATTPGLRMPIPPQGQIPHRPPVHVNLAEYNPDAPSMEPRLWARQPFRNAGRLSLRGAGGLGMIRGAGGIYTSHHQRELIRVPTEGQEPQYFPTINPNKRLRPSDFPNDMETMPPMKQRFDYNRLGMGGNCSLQLKKVPVGLNNIAHLHNHFVKFGKIVNIQVCFEGDPEAALITFTSNAEASAAYKSTEAVLNNRFIKVFWHNPSNNSTKKQEVPLPTNRMSAKDRLGAPVLNPTVTNVSTNKRDQENETQKVLFSGSNITKTVYIPSAAEYKPTMAVRPDAKKMVITTPNYVASPEALAAKEALKKREEKRKEGLKLSQNIAKRKHDLLDNLLKHQSQLIEKLENGEMTSEQRAEIMSTIQVLQENMKTIRNELKAAVTKPTNPIKVTPQLVKKSKEEVIVTQKQILDAELDLFTQQQEGKDTSELQKRVLELKTKEQSLNMLTTNRSLRPPPPTSRFRTSRGRGAFNPHATVDHRPTKLLVSGFESDDKVEVIEHFSKFGEVVDQVWDEATPALVIQYKTRKEAETAMAKGRNFQDRLMSVTWFNQAQNMPVRNSGMRSVIMMNESELLSGQEDEDEEMRNLEVNEDFLLGDEEEDEDDERSWRR